jgi:hypothetical protein
MIAAVVTSWLSADWWTAAIGRSLICERAASSADAILVENFDPNYATFERAARLRRIRQVLNVYVPVTTGGEPSHLDTVALGFADVMASVARLGDFKTIPIREVEPISLHAAEDVLRALQREHVRSVVVVSPLFRSRRSALVYGAMLRRAGIAVTCEPAGDPQMAKTWTHTWHGIQNVLEQWIKLQYYRFYVLPFLA